MDLCSLSNFTFEETMLSEIINPTCWKLQSIEQQFQDTQAAKDRASNLPVNAWFNPDSAISPVKLYAYLKARFGAPNGFIMILKNKTSDNLIHWHYALTTSHSTIHIFGKTTGLEIIVKTGLEIVFSDAEWDTLVTGLKSEIALRGKEVSKTQTEFEHWALFINPFCRVEYTLQDCISRLQKLKLMEVTRPALNTKEAIDKYLKETNKWVNNTMNAASLGTMIRMLSPVMAEAFINLVILVFRKEEYKKDSRLYDSLLRQQIDVRIKTLHFNCTCFPEQINSDSEAFKKFHSLMNKRNDFLHGNVDPNKLIVEEVWFDQKTIPLFAKDEGVIKKMTKNYCTNVEPETAIADFQTVSNLIELVLMAMDDDSLRQFVQIMSDRMPGINKKSNRLGVLFPSQYLVESFAY